jgi:hypothetical protein
LLILSLMHVAFARPACQTSAMREAAALLATAGEGYRTAAFRPDAAGYVDSALYPIRVHYRRPEDADRAANVVLPALETSWLWEIVDGGWPAPPADGGIGGSDALDVYLTNEGTFGGAYVYGLGPDVTANDNWYSVPSYMALDEAIPDTEMLAYVAHELTHVSQYTIDAWEWRTFVWESVAEVMSELVDDSSNLYIPYGAMPDFQEFPFLSLVFDGYHPAVIAYDAFSYYEYGGIVFMMFVEQRDGINDGRTLLALWDGLAQPSTSREPDFLDSLEAIDTNLSLAELYAEFAVWRMFTGEFDDGAHFEEAALWGEGELVGLEAMLSLDEVEGYAAGPVDAPYDLGTSYYAVDLTGGTEDLLEVDVAGAPASQWGIAWAVWYPEGPGLTGTVVGVPGEAVKAQIPLAGGVRAQFGVVNGGPPGMDADAQVQRQRFELTLARVAPPPEPDTGEVPEVPETPDEDTAAPPAASRPEGPVDADGGCGCASSGTGTVGWTLLAPLILRRRSGRGRRATGA